MIKQVTAAELLKIKSFNDKVRLVDSDVDLNKKITHVTIMEAPDLYQWVTGGELVLTTWYAFSKEPELQEESFRKLVSKISAIGIKTNRFIKHIPNSVLAIAKEAKVPVFEVHYSVKFRELVTVVNSQIQNYQTNMLIEVDSFYKKLMNQSLNSDNISPLVKLLADDLQQTVICLDHNYLILANINNKRLTKEALDEIYGQVKRCIISTNADADTIGDKLHLFGCYARNRLIGILVIVKEGPLNEKENIITQQAASFLSMKIWLNYQTRQKAIDRFWNKLINGEIISVQEIYLKLKEFSIINEDYKYIYIFAHDNRIKSWFEILNRDFNNKIIIEDETYTIMFGSTKNYAKQLCQLKIILEKTGRNNLVVTTGAFDDIQNIKEQFTLLLTTFKLLHKLNYRNLQVMDDYLSYILLSKKTNSVEYQYIKKRVLEPLIEYDSKFQSNLLPVLYVALTGDSMEAAAKKLYIHVNTLRYKLRKIQELTGKNFFDNKDKYVLLTVVLLWKSEMIK